MGCCVSSFSKVSIPPNIPLLDNHKNNILNLPAASNGADNTPPSADFPPFLEFSLADLQVATNNFNPDHIVSESGEKALNVVYKGRLHNQNRRSIAVKKFTKLAWPDPQQFADEALGVGKLRHKRLSQFDWLLL